MADSKEEQLQKRQQNRYLNRSVQLSSKYLHKLEEFPNVPDNFRYFSDILRTIFVDNQIIRYDNEKLVGTYCVMCPQELVYAAGARPIKLCSGNYIGFHFGDDVTPRDACPLVKSIIGNNLIGGCSIYDYCSMYVVPITCDCKKKMASMLNDYKETYSLHVPVNKTDDDAMDYYIKDLYKLKAKLENLTNREITREDILNQIYIMAEVQAEIYKFIQIKNYENLLIRGSHAMAIMNSFSYDDMRIWGKNLKNLNNELLSKMKAGQFITKKKLPRILLTGSPMVFPNLKVPLLIEEMGGIVVGDETCMGDRGLYDPVALFDNSMDSIMEALANRYIRPCSCPTFSDNNQRIHRIEQMIKNGKVDGVIYHVLRGCLVYDYEYTMLEKRMGELDIPIIRVESDYNEEDIEQLRIRMEAFVEMIKFKDIKI